MSNKKYIEHGSGLPKWDNPISHAVVVNNMCFISGQLSVDNEGNFVEDNIKEETKRAFDNFISAVVNSGFQKEDVVFIDIAFNDLSDLPEVNEVFMGLFEEGKRPARTIYQAQALPFGGKVKITGTAVKDLV
jgi:2-iminobutanoate/2-iminopropanoate deaminase